MKIFSIQVSKAKPVKFHGKQILTGIYKTPIQGSVRVLKNGLMGDEQANLSVHGGPNKAVYAYGLEAYTWWKNKIHREDLRPGFFGENLTVEGWKEDEIYAGDIFQTGSVELQVVQPRQPCFKLGIKAEDPSILETFQESGLWGIYFRVMKEGEIKMGDDFKRTNLHPAKINMKELYKLCFEDFSNKKRMKECLTIDSLPTSWKEKIEQNL